MDIEKYEELTGLTVASSEQNAVLAQIRRTRTLLENMLGYSLLKNKAGINQYEEKGKTTVDCVFRWNGLIDTYDTITLSDPDEVQGSYRLFRYNQNDQYLEVDPFTKLYAVKLVFIKLGDEPNGITHKTFTNGVVRVQKTNGISKYIERCKECLCTCTCSECLQLAVDADWLSESCLPDELQYLWADMVQYYTDSKRDLKSETLGPHSWTKSNVSRPEELSESINIIKKYAGPNGSVNKSIVA